MSNRIFKQNYSGDGVFEAYGDRHFGKYDQNDAYANNDRNSELRAILYIGGYFNKGKESSTYKWLKSNFNNEILDVDPMFKPINDVLTEVKEIIIEYNPIIVSNSFGCFISSFFSQPTVWINPCLYPAEVLPKLDKTISQALITDIVKHQELRDEGYTLEDRPFYFPVVSDQDELIDNSDLTAFTSNTPVVVKGGTHRLNDGQREQYVKPLIEKVLKKFPVMGLTESYHNYIGLDNIAKVADEVAEILMSSYKDIGGCNIENAQDLLAEKNLFQVKTYTSCGKIIACEIFKKFDRLNQYRKIIAVGTDGTVEGKAVLKKMMYDDATRADRKMYMEVSDAPEHIYIKYGALPIPNCYVEQILGKPISKLCDDGYHYIRTINGLTKKKIMVANNKSFWTLLDDSDTMSKLDV